ncbi:ATP synthase epsilon chain [bacterium HR35]|nr:ATP synthase epsilon chain [bacterium HR35]
MKKFKFILVGIEGNIIEEDIDVLICQTDLGEISVLANHHPLLTVVKQGEIKVKIDNEEKKYFLPFDSILEVKENIARILVMFPL